MTNFDFLKSEPQFDSFSGVAIIAERVLAIDPDACIMKCRRAMEIAIKWMYSVDSSLKPPYQDTLVSLMNTDEFRDIVDNALWNRMDFIRRIGNDTTHSSKRKTYDQATLCLQNLFYFFDFVAYCYAADYQERAFDSTKLSQGDTAVNELETAALEIAALQEKIKSYEEQEKSLKDVMLENLALKETLTTRREEQHATYTPKPLDMSEAKTRKIYIDAMLLEADWIEGKDWVNEVPVKGMPNKSGDGAIDYVLYDDTLKPLAIVEAKSTCRDVSEGRQQAELYANILEKEYGRRPVIFLTNGFETRINDGWYPERKVATIYSKRDLEKLFNLQRTRTSLKNIHINERIAGRYYQKAAIKEVCDSFSERKRRKALLVMATGSGKTRTVMALCDVLLQAGWIKNILFLADRNSLVTQAKRSFVNFLPDLSVTNLVEDKENYNANCIFSTYQTMMNCIDTIRDEQGKLFTSGHFDLLICDEAHRSIYNKYKDIFTYFDAPLIGLTATPKDEIDKNTYQIFELENGVPTYGYELAQGVQDGYLVDFLSVETTLKFIEKGIVYDELSDEDKAAYEDTFVAEDGSIPESISASALNTWLFNEDTIRQVLTFLLDNGLKVDYGNTIGKTIIFAKNHNHAEEILRVFNKEFPHLTNYAKVIDNYINYAQSAIDDFSEASKLPQIAISVDMLDTGIDIEEILNLVFFKRVLSKAKFWQMIGRGTRLSEGLIDGVDKDKFYIFDFCGNFEFFRMSKGKPTTSTKALQGTLFHQEFQLAYLLQRIEYQSEELIAFRDALIESLTEKIKKLNRENFAVKQHLKYVDMYSNKANYVALTYEDTRIIQEELVDLILPSEDEINALRFDALLYGIELAHLSGKKYGKARSDLTKRLQALSKIANIPEIQAQSGLISKLLHTDYLDTAGFAELEFIRKSLRHLMKFLRKEDRRYDTNFEDDILSIEWNESEAPDELRNYKAKAEYYIRQNQNHIVIAKLRLNKPLTGSDITSLEELLWQEVGTKEEYEEAYGAKPLGEFIREIVGLDMNAAKEAFSKFLESTALDSRQIYFVNQIVEYIVHNGLMKDFSVLQGPPFTDKGSIVEVFTDIGLWQEVQNIIREINTNAVA